MATSNFKTNDYAPIWAFDADAFYNEEMEFYDYDADCMWNYDVEKILLDDFNVSSKFCQIKCVSGYYSGYQLFVNVPENPRFVDDGFARDEWGMTQAEADSEFASEVSALNEYLDKNAPCFDFEKYEVAARFSNGETWYSKVKEA